MQTCKRKHPLQTASQYKSVKTITIKKSKKDNLPFPLKQSVDDKLVDLFNTYVNVKAKLLNEKC